MDTKTIEVDGKIVEIVTGINHDIIEDNSDLFDQDIVKDDTLDLSKLSEMIKEGDLHE